MVRLTLAYKAGKLKGKFNRFGEVGMPGLKQKRRIDKGIIKAWQAFNVKG